MPEPVVHPTPTPCPARVLLRDGAQLDVTFWLLGDPAREGRPAPLDGLLGGRRRFLAVGLPAGGSALLSRDGIVTVSVEADHAGAPAEGDGTASLDVVTLHLDDGSEIAGVLRAVAADGGERMSDVFNAAGPFLPIGVGSRVVLVNRDRVVRVTF